MSTLHPFKSALTPLAIALLVGFVGLQQSAPAQAQAAPTAQGNPCSTAKTAVVGAVLGAALGKFTHHSMLKGAALGGAVGALACVTINYQSHRTQTAAQIRQEQPQLAANPQVVVTGYQMQVAPGNLPAGQTVNVLTNVNVVSGAQEPIQSIDVRYTLIDSSGNPQQTVTKPIDGVSADGGGYQGTLSFTPPAGVPRGAYSIRADLLVNGQVRSQQNASYNII
jgi:hypothetical protein